MRISLPSIMALTSFSRAFSASLQTVFLETFIFAAASSKVSFSSSTSLRASISAGSRRIGSASLLGVGSNFSGRFVVVMATGFGGLPILPCLWRFRHWCWNIALWNISQNINTCWYWDISRNREENAKCEEHGTGQKDGGAQDTMAPSMGKNPLLLPNRPDRRAENPTEL